MKYLIVFALLLVGCSSKPGYRFRISMDGGKVETTACDQAPAFDEYMAKLNETLRPQNRECVELARPTTESRAMRCGVVNGPVEGLMYWAESKSACETLKKGLG